MVQAIDMMTEPDHETVVITGRVLTLDVDDTVCEGLAIRGDRIVATGTAAEMRARVRLGARLIEMPGATVIPGFNDVHAHLEREGLKYLRPSLADCRSIADIQAVIRRKAAEVPEGTWIITMPIGTPPFFFKGPSNLAEGRPPNRYELDAAAPRHPVYIPGVFINWSEPPGYNCLNSLALSLNGITAASESPAKGIQIEKDAEGIPTGVILEHNMRPMVEFALLKAVPRFSYADRRAGIRKSMQFYNEVGTTSVYEGHGSSAQIISLYRELWAAGELTVRMGLVVSPPWRDLNEVGWMMQEWLAFARESGIGDAWLRISGVHVARWGDCDPATAKLAQRDLPNTGWAGFVEHGFDKDEYEAVCRLAAIHGMRFHTIVSDKLDDILPVLERVHAAHNLHRRRWVVEHIGRTSRPTLERLKALDVIVTTIPVTYVWKDGHDYRLEWGNDITPMRTLLELGFDPAAATDNVPYNPCFTMWSMCERIRRSDGAVLGPDERLTRQQALRAVTVAGARLTYDEHRKGPLAAGYLADLAVFEENPLTTPAETLKNLRSSLTMVGGRVVHGAITKSW
jgi:predicted amidohydrolase YtcJ